MKKLIKWILKFDGIWIILFFSVFLGFIIVYQKDAAMKSFCTLFALPIVLFVLQNLMQRKQENHCYNVDLYIKETARDELIWKVATDNSKDNISYLCIKNSGKVDIFSLYIKVTKNDGAVGWFRIAENLGVDKEWVVCIPYKKENLKEIVLTCSVLSESRTKKFNGIKSSNEKITIFSNSEFFDSEKYAIYNEKGYEVFEKMQCFLV